MKRIAKWTTMLLSLALVMNCLTFNSVGDVILPVDEVTASETEFEIFDEPAVREEIVEWREDGVKHYYLGNGMYQAVVSADVADENVASPAAATPGSSAIKDTFISSLRTNVSYGSNSTLLVSDTQTAFIGFQLPVLQDNAYIESARLYFQYYFSSETATNMTIGVYPVMFAWEEGELNWDIANTYANLGISTTSLGYCGLGVTTNPRQANVAVSDIVKSWYETQGATNYGIALKKYSSAASTVTLLSKESGSANAPYIVINYTLQNLPVENGEYYLRNAQYSQLFLRKSASSSDWDDTEIETGERYCELMLVDPSNNLSVFKWNFEYLHNGYYRIQNIGEDLCIAVREDKEDTGNISLIREQFVGKECQQWKIISLSDGTYKIKPKSSESYDTDWVMAVKVRDDCEGHNANQMAYSGSDDIRNDQWYIQPMNPTPRISLDTSIYYDNLTLENLSVTGNDVHSLLNDFQEASEWFLIMYGIELKTPTIAYDSSIEIDSACCVSNDKTAICTEACAPLDHCMSAHHKAASNFYSRFPSNRYRTCKFVGSAICGYKEEERSHISVRGATRRTNAGFVVSSQTTYCEGYPAPNTIQHELSHTFNTDDHAELNGINCIMNGHLNYWCSVCYENIKNYVEMNTGGN